MKVFISWSGEKSREIASALKNWLPDVLQHIKTWMSEHDIDAGSRWSNQLTEVLSDCNIGIIVLTPESQKSPWILFEAGALSKSIDVSRVIPFLVEVSPSDVEPPLSQFQTSSFDKKGISSLVKSINRVTDNPLSEERLNRLIDKWWPDIEKNIREIISRKREVVKTPARNERDVLNEILQLVRVISRDSSSNKYPNKHDLNYATIFINTATIIENGIFHELSISTNEEASNFLDEVYYLIRSDMDMPSYKYGELWLLRNERTGEIFNNIGIEYCKSRGEIWDKTKMRSLDIKEADVLSVIPLQNQ